MRRTGDRFVTSTVRDQGETYVGRSPVLGDEAAGLVVDRLGGPAELAEHLHVREGRHLQYRPSVCVTLN